jgi:DNA-binding transcriptional regulator GbsR (MarR family)
LLAFLQRLQQESDTRLAKILNGLEMPRAPNKKYQEMDNKLLGILEEYEVLKHFYI